MLLKNHQTQDKRKAQIRMYSALFLYICSLSKTWDPEDVDCVWNYLVRILWSLKIRWSLIRYNWRSWVPCSIELSRSLAQGILRFVSSVLWTACQGKQEKMQIPSYDRNLLEIESDFGTSFVFEGLSKANGVMKLTSFITTFQHWFL